MTYAEFLQTQVADRVEFTRAQIRFKIKQSRERSDFLRNTIEAHNGNLRAAARALGMHRWSLCRLVKQYGLVENYGDRPTTSQVSA